MNESTSPAGDKPPLRIAVLVSGTGSNLQAIIDTLHGRGAVEIACVASDKLGCRAIERAGGAGIATRGFPASEHGGDREARDRALGDWIEERGARLIVLAGYMQLLSPAFVRRFEHRVINVHPSLLPSFPGLQAIERAVESGAEKTGVTVHFVDEGVDTGPVIAQREIPIERPADIERIEQDVHAVEHELLPQVIADFAAGRVRVDPADPRAVQRS